jgi:two-component system chemotaxis response regulator CheY
VSLNVLVVDDSFVMREMIIRTLRASGLPIGAIREARNGKEALEALETEWMDLALVDVNMPVMNGEEFLEKVRASESLRGLPVVVVSSESSPKRIERLKSKNVEFIHKPFTAEELRDAVIPLVGVTDAPIVERQLLDVAAESMEKMCFLVPAEGPGPIPEKAPPLEAATEVRFRGPRQGRLIVAADSGLYATLAANMLALDEADPRQRQDALGEMANVICGNLVPLLGAERGDFELEAPVPAAPQPLGANLADLETSLLFDEGYLTLALCLDRRPEA